MRRARCRLSARSASLRVLPSAWRRARYSRAGVWMRPWVIAIRCSARLSWRLPWRFSRRRGPGELGQLGVRFETVDAGHLGDQLGRGQWSAAGQGEQLRRLAADERAELALERFGLPCQLAAAA